ncbi:MAG: cell division protease FtsH, partial [Acidobacteriota bacterium]|nr:cell division protease FtsH [Acidobacteriota bacterium]
MLYQFVVNKQGREVKQLPYGELVEKIRNGQIAEITMKQAEVVSVDKDKNEFKTPIDVDKVKGDLVALSIEKDANGQTHVKKVQIEPVTSGAFWSILMWWGPVLLLVGFWIFMLRQMQSGGNKALSFGKSRAKLLNNQQKRVTFKDVAGVDEAKEELQEIIEFLKEPQKFQKLGGRIPKGVLLVGAPGTGKTLMARAVAGEANVPFFSISGSDFV